MLDIFRIRKSKSLYSPDHEHIFLEIDKNRWIEIESLDGVTVESIRIMLEAEKQSGIKLVCFTEQNFQVGTIKDWEHSGWIK